MKNLIQSIHFYVVRLEALYYVYVRKKHGGIMRY